jgi:hypothetical protein
MPRRVRFIPEGGALVEITTRTIQGRHLLTPGPAVNEVVLGVLGRAQRLHKIPCCGICVLSSHYHLLLRVEDAEEMADFMEYIEIEKEALALRKQKQDKPRGVEEILRQDPHTRPRHLNRSPAPAFHAASKATREMMRQAYGLFLAAFREASEKLRSGDRNAPLS